MASVLVVPWRLVFFVLTAALPLLALAGPLVNVALQSSFNAGPYLLELLETAAEENSTSYFPLLDRIAEGVFDDAVTEKELYDRFLKVLLDGGHLQDAESFSSFKFALAIRSAAPRIEAHYQYYNTSVQPSLKSAQDAACPIWVHAGGKQYCSSTLERAQQDVSGQSNPRELPFDRVLGDISAPPSVLYADIASPMFNEFHQKLSLLAREDQISYRVRYRPSQHAGLRPLFVSGYGVELALKRTDYIVIDDRDAQAKDEQGSKNQVTSSVEEELKEESPADLRPLSTSEVARLGVNAASFIMGSADPFDTLVKLCQDFPRHSSTVAGHNASENFLNMFSSQSAQASAQAVPAGYSAMWINGIQIGPRQIDAYSLLEHLRRERKLIDNFNKIGLSSSEITDLLSHPAITESQVNDEPPRYDYRDDVEDGGVIIWLNDIEKDKRYEGWPTSSLTILQRMFPGQLPNVRQNVHNVVVPVDFANSDDIHLIVNFLFVFIKRKVPVRFGLVPVVHSKNGISQFKIVHHLHETYGLSALMTYLEESMSKKTFTARDKSAFQVAITDRETRLGARSRGFEEIMETNEFEDVISRISAYLKRLDCDGTTPIAFVNGVVMSRDENWMQDMPMRLSRDVQSLQQLLIEGVIEEDTWLAGHFLSQSALSRSEWIIPKDPNDIRIINLATIANSNGDILNTLPRVTSGDGENSITKTVHVVVISDFNTKQGLKFLTAALNFRQLHPEADVILLHNPEIGSSKLGASSRLYHLRDKGQIDAAQLLGEIEAVSGWNLDEDAADEIFLFWERMRPLVTDFGFAPGKSGIVLNGIAVGPPPTNVDISIREFEQLLAFERVKRIEPVSKSLTALNLNSKISDPFDFAKLTSLVALATISDVPEGIFESGSKLRFNVLTEWAHDFAVIDVTNSLDAKINIIAAIDPTTEQSQRWIPILKVLSKLVGVNIKVLLNPRDQIQELPIKRFYRHVLEAEPVFDSAGALRRPGASFTGLPEEALLNLGMDIPPSWLVAPKESVYDLDNIKLSSLKKGSNVDAIYELEHILIEGHSRDTTNKLAPRGVQLLLGTENDPHFSDTIIMANLGYFQFKAQPGFWKIGLKPGRSQRIFSLDSAGGLGYTPKSGDENTEVALLSFQGRTLFPRLSRKPGREEEDVLETGPKPGSAMEYVSKGLNLASGVLSSVGVNSKGESAEKHADINIFSVASGHLYERMLNIMMVSVMQHTKHTVKFWFIEQFLSPSFKEFLPHLSEKYGFSYEMVTYKWPHWLRGQREKQREIWGYKILFLDVLFPLSLDKVIFVDADQIVRTDMYNLVTLDLEGAPYGFTPMCDSRETMEGFRFWKQGYWKSFLQGLPYHISALFVVDLNRFRAIAAGDRLRGQYQTLSADAGSLSNLDQDLPNHMQHVIPIKSLPQDWLWCETWCSDEALTTAKTIDLCNNPLTKEPKLDRARRQVPEWTEYDDQIAALVKHVAAEEFEQQAGETPTGRENVEQQKDEL